MAVGFGAFGAHGLKRMVEGLPADQATRILGWVDTGAKYQLVHAAALLALASLPARTSSAAIPWVARALFYGSLIFSSTLYAMALGAPLWMGAITPIGGVLLLAGWGLLLFA
jgi:uncharacterized membrane protein YgdD (TMEM256/DUF423 family)